MKPYFFLLLLAAAVAAVACLDKVGPPVDHVDGGAADGGGGGSGGSQGHTDGGLPATQACTTINQARCEYLGRCGLVGDSAAAQRECIAYFNATWCAATRWPSRVDPAVHTVRYDGVLAQLCADDFTTRACADFQTTSDPCAAMLTPNVPQRGQCYDGFPECLYGVCRGTSCPRTCQSKGLIDEVCQIDSDCAPPRAGPPLYCRIPPGSFGTGLCTLMGIGGKTCDATLLCAPGFSCVANVCTALPTSGQACPYGRCNDAAYCAAVDGGLCVPRLASGTACVDDSQCVPTDLCEPISGTCQPQTLMSEGNTCGPRQSCPLTLSCVGVAPPTLGACLTPGPEGTACLTPDDCEPELSCLSVDGGTQCARRRAAGQPCHETRDCRLLSTCLAGVCTPIPAVGASCAVVPQCQWGHCVPEDGGALCEEAAGPGATCAVDEDCRSGRCESGHCTAACVP